MFAAKLSLLFVALRWRKRFSVKQPSPVATSAVSTLICCAAVLAFPVPSDESCRVRPVAPGSLSWSSAELRARAEWLPWQDLELEAAEALSNANRHVTEIEGHRSGVRVFDSFVGPRYTAVAVVYPDDCRVIFSRDQLGELFAPLSSAEEAAAFAVIQVNTVHDPSSARVHVRAALASPDTYWVEVPLSESSACVVRPPRSVMYAVHRDGAMEQLAIQDRPY